MNMKQYIRKTIKFYDENVENYIRSTGNLQEKDRLMKFISYLPKGARILDLGCAFGRDCKFFAENGFETYGVDLSTKMIEKANDYAGKARFYVMNALDLKFKNDYFDGVWCISTLLHIKKKDYPAALSEVRRILKKGGIFYLSIKEGSGERLVKDERYGGAEKFYSYFTENEIKNMLIKSGFKVLSSELIYFKDKYRQDAGRINLIAKKD
jgi:ubiquinone/menaquinone biosynthesis C-methylase UbiE